jgi:hypothetical protein
MSLIDRIHEYHKAQRDMYARQIELIESGVLTTRTNNLDTTAESLKQIKEWKPKSKSLSRKLRPNIA